MTKAKYTLDLALRQGAPLPSMLRGPVENVSEYVKHTQTCRPCRLRRLSPHLDGLAGILLLCYAWCVCSAEECLDMKRVRYFARPMIIAIVCIGCSGCFGLRNRAVLQHACDDCRDGPFCAFQTLEPRYCLLCQQPLDGRASMTKGERYAELQEVADALSEAALVSLQHATAQEERNAALRVHRQSGAIKDWIARERSVDDYLENAED